MQPAPGPDQFACCRAGAAGRGGVELVVGRQYDEEGVGPVGEHQHGADGPAPVVRLPRGEETERAGNDGEARLHGKTARIARLPLRQQAVVVEAKARRLFGEVDVEGGAGKRRAERKSELTCKHGASPATRSNWQDNAFPGAEDDGLPPLSYGRIASLYSAAAAGTSRGVNWPPSVAVMSRCRLCKVANVERWPIETIVVFGSRVARIP